MGDEKDAFYVVRKGDIIGIYTNFADCQAQASLSPLDPSVSVYKGYNLSKETESYLVSRGLRQPSYSISATDVHDEMFGVLSVCPFQDVGESSRCASHPPKQPSKLENYVDPQTSVSPGCATIPAFNAQNEKHDVGELSRYAYNPPRQPIKLENYVEPQASVPTFNGWNEKHLNAGLNIFPTSSQQNCDVLKNVKPLDQFRPSCASEPSSFLSNPQKRVTELKNYLEPEELLHPIDVNQSCTIEFDGASKGNPGLAGAGAILRAIDGSQVWLLREGVGIATNNVAEYRSVILGLRSALEKGFKHVKVRGDSLLVCNQILGKWKTKNENMANLCQKALHLKKQFSTFTIEHVAREFNSAADALANRAINLRDGQVEMEQSRA